MESRVESRYEVLHRRGVHVFEYGGPGTGTERETDPVRRRSRNVKTEKKVGVEFVVEEGLQKGLVGSLSSGGRRGP